jgi:hypothetical protein
VSEKVKFKRIGAGTPQQEASARARNAREADAARQTHQNPPGDTMTLVLELPAEVETQLRADAAARGVAVEDYAVEKLRRTPSETEQQLQALDELLSLGARLTAGTEPLADDAVARSYEEYHDGKAAA